MRAKSIINTKFGQNYSKTRIYKTKNNNAQEAHEAIRPTNFNIEEIGKNENEKRLYNLIWRRTLASQMSDSIFERTLAKISISNSNLNFKAEGEVQIFDGFLYIWFVFFAALVFFCVCVIAVPQPVVVNNRLRNVPQEGIYACAPGAYFGMYRPDTFWLAP